MGFDVLEYQRRRRRRRRDAYYYYLIHITSLHSDLGAVVECVQQREH